MSKQTIEHSTVVNAWSEVKSSHPQRNHSVPPRRSTLPDRSAATVVKSSSALKSSNEGPLLAAPSVRSISVGAPIVRPPSIVFAPSAALQERQERQEPRLHVGPLQRFGVLCTNECAYPCRTEDILCKTLVRCGAYRVLPDFAVGGSILPLSITTFFAPEFTRNKKSKESDFAKYKPMTCLYRSGKHSVDHRDGNPGVFVACKKA